VKRLTNSWKNAVFGTLVPGVALAIVAAPNLIWKDSPAPFWKMLGNLAAILCCLGAVMWLFFAISTLYSDITKLWKKSKLVSLVIWMAIVLLATLLQRFTGPHFYGWHADAWLFFFMALLLGSYLLLKISVSLTSNREK
jgi:hypothetical protein